MRARRRAVGVATAACCLAGILVAAAALHDGVRLAYDESGNGCRVLTDASAHNLALALIPVRVLVAGWVLATGLALTAGLSRRAGGISGGAWLAVTVAAAALAAWEQAFIGTDGLSGALPLLVLWLAVLIAVVALAGTALIDRRRLARWLWAFVGWLLAAGGALPLALLTLTTDGAVRSC